MRRAARSTWFLLFCLGFISPLVPAASAGGQPIIFSACVRAKTGFLYNQQEGTPPRCREGDLVTSWNQTGPQGPQGPTGEKGDPGPQGPAARGPSGWLDAASNAITAVATLVIAGFSIVTWVAFRWQKKKEQRDRMPVLVFTDEIIDECRNLYVKNVGAGPALDIVRVITGRGDRVATTVNEPLLLGSLGQGEKVYAYCATLRPDNSVPVTDDPRFQATVEYDDIFGNHYESRYEQRHHLTPVKLPQRKIPWAQIQRL